MGWWGGVAGEGVNTHGGAFHYFFAQHLSLET